MRSWIETGARQDGAAAGMGLRKHTRTSRWAPQGVALALAASIVAPGLAGCGGQQASAPPPLDATQGQAPMSPGANNGRAASNSGGMSTRNKVILLAGAAALYYMYKKQRDARNRPVNVQYYLSKNGRVYYREPNNPRQVIYVTPPRQALRVPESELQGLNLEQFQGYNGAPGGRDLTGLPAGEYR